MLPRAKLSNELPGHYLAWIIHEYGEIWVEQGFSPAFTVRLGLAALAAEVHTVRNSGIASGAKARMVAGFSAGLKACSTRFMNNPG